jgi:hypothetical protein
MRGAAVGGNRNDERSVIGAGVHRIIEAGGVVKKNLPNLYLELGIVALSDRQE